MLHKTVCIFLLIFCLVTGTNAGALDMMLPEVYEDNIDVTNWLMSEKLDGVRGFWDGERLLSKNGLPFNPPPAFLKNFPDFALEGEIWGGRNSFEKTVSIVKTQDAHSGWFDLKFGIFDVPRAGGGFEQRLNVASQWFAQHPSEHAFVISQKYIKGREQMKEELLRIEKMGGEGLIIRKPDSLYMIGRSDEILKVKSYDEMEAVVIGHIEGRGRNQGRMGALLVELPDRRRFNIGTGFSDEHRDNPPPICSIITFKYYGFYKSGIPRFPSFLRMREDNSF